MVDHFITFPCSINVVNLIKKSCNSGTEVKVEFVFRKRTKSRGEMVESLISQMNCHRPYTKNKGNLMKKGKNGLTFSDFGGLL